ncbi:MAG: T9SS type A sorting domain-containing protein [Ginsengibacter sp.]
MLFDKTNQYLVRSIGIVTIFFFTTAFIIKSNEKIFSNPDVIVSVAPEYGGLTVSVKTSKNTNVRFYMFSVEGRLVKELNIIGSQKISIIELEKGIYIYDFFSNDKRLKNGKIELR